MKKMVLKLSLEDEKSKRRVFKAVAGVEGVDSVTVDMKEKKITVIGDADPVSLTSKLRKFGHTELLSVGPAKEEKKEASKQEQKKKDEKKPEPVPTILYYPPNYNHRPYEYNTVAQNDYNSCTIC